MPSFLLWNVGQLRFQQRMVELAHEHHVDVLILLECGFPPGPLLQSLNARSTEYQLTASACDWMTIYVRFSNQFIRPVREADRFTIRRINLPGTPELLLVAAHLRSKLRANENTQARFCRALAAEIRMAEEDVGHQRTLLLGDLNVNPFEQGLVAVDALNAVMSRETANWISRLHDRTEHRFFYNPMWGRFGDNTPGPAGTYYHDGGEVEEYHWHMLDQVLLRPSLLPLFNDANLHILQEVRGQTLLTPNGRPSLAHGSDHLPVLFSLASNLI